MGESRFLRGGPEGKGLSEGMGGSFDYRERIVGVLFFVDGIKILPCKAFVIRNRALHCGGGACDYYRRVKISVIGL